MKTEIILERQENFVDRRDREQECKTIMIFALRSRTQKSCLNDEKSTTKEYYWDSESLSLSHLLPDTEFFFHRVFYASFITFKMCYLLCLNNSLGRSRTNHALFNVEKLSIFFGAKMENFLSLSARGEIWDSRVKKDIAVMHTNSTKKKSHWKVHYIFWILFRFEKDEKCKKSAD